VCGAGELDAMVSGYQLSVEISGLIRKPPESKDCYGNQENYHLYCHALRVTRHLNGNVRPKIPVLFLQPRPSTKYSATYRPDLFLILFQYRITLINKFLGQKTAKTPVKIDLYRPLAYHHFVDWQLPHTKNSPRVPGDLHARKNSD
jgi:hypothetical protein